MIIALIIMGSIGFGATTTVALDPELSRLLNTALNFATLWLLYRHRSEVRKEVRPAVKDVQEKVDHLDETLNQGQAGGRRTFDPPAESA